jgi:nucleoside-diphosphate-sugar epimerase
VDGIISAIETAHTNRVFNIGSDREISVRALAELIWALVNGEDDEPLIDVVPYESFGKYEDVQRRVPDLTRARELLGYAPRVSLEEGLRRTIAWQIDRRKALAAST